MTRSRSLALTATPALIVLATATTATAAPAATGDGHVIFGVTSNGNRLVSFPASDPGAAAVVTTANTGTISGLGPGERVVATDFRPSDGLLYALTLGQASGSGAALTGTGRLYTVNTTSAVATPVGTLGVSLSGSFYDMGFDPVDSSLRIVSSNGQNLHVTGAGLTSTVADTALSYASGDVHAGQQPLVAAIDVKPGATPQLFDIDYSLDTLASQVPASGVLTSIGTTGLGVNVTNLLGFDFEPDGTGYVTALTQPSPGSVSDGTELFTVDTSSGKLTLVGDVAGDVLDSIAIDPSGPSGPPSSLPEFPLTALAPVGALGVAGVVLRRRRRA